MEDSRQKYCVYMHINKINGKKYIGITGQKPTVRWNNGKGYNTNPYFYNAIQRYGWDNFEHIIYQTGLTKGQACGLEKQLILLFETRNPDKGYNISGGGEAAGYIDGRCSSPDYKKNSSKRFRENQTPEKREERLAKKRVQNLTPEQREEKKRYQNEWQKKHRQNETPEQREKRLKRLKEYRKKKKEERNNDSH